MSVVCCDVTIEAALWLQYQRYLAAAGEDVAFDEPHPRRSHGLAAFRAAASKAACKMSHFLFDALEQLASRLNVQEVEVATQWATVDGLMREYNATVGEQVRNGRLYLTGIAYE
jgi:hypothetical protein